RIPRLPGHPFQYIGPSFGGVIDRGLRGSWSGRGAWRTSPDPTTVGLSADRRTHWLPAGGLRSIYILCASRARYPLESPRASRYSSGGVGPPGWLDEMSAAAIPPVGIPPTQQVAEVRLMAKPKKRKQPRAVRRGVCAEE